MCGICGLYSSGRILPEDERLVRGMCGVMTHRGPDDEGFYADETAALGMRRLKIIDLVTGHQPIFNEDRSVVTVLNGEIYNFQELREELAGKGHVFRTRSDTEVIVHLYEEKGEDFVHSLNGMFAIALWDIRGRKMILARDRLGVKPLHYLFLNDKILFASEIKSLLESRCPREIDTTALSQFFTFEYVPAPRTIFKGVQKLLPGRMMVIANGRSRIVPYWNVRYTADRSPRRNEDELAAELHDRLEQSVRKRLISDVPLGVFLSGGIDSSSVTALMSRAASSPIKTFSIGFKEKSFDELRFGRAVAEAFKTEHTEFVVESSRVKELVPILMKYLDEPLADASIIPTYIISKLAREHVTVALAGDGGDELFGGYDTYKAFRLARLYRKFPRLVRDGVVKKIVQGLPASKKRLSFEFKAKKFISGIDFPPEIANTIWWGAYAPSQKENLLSPGLASTLSGDPFEPIRHHLNIYSPEDMLDRICYLDLKLYLQDDLLVKVDRMSMANSLEIRVPFLDYTFVDFATSIPNSLKLKGFTTKYILKKAMAKDLPADILRRKKIGFDIPLGVWIQNELRDFAADVLSPAALRKHGFFNEAFVQRILAEHLSGAHNHRQLLWPLIIFQFWYHEYIAG
ncbi:MAG: asparagine synthase (glutamine-hydrolyzing) [Acidobacteriota bacterium]|nr:asparagine synthase (glutamine-hydrolyzing) [Acidobacteriota bacterium]